MHRQTASIGGVSTITQSNIVRASSSSSLKRAERAVRQGFVGRCPTPSTVRCYAGGNAGICKACLSVEDLERPLLPSPEERRQAP